MLSEAPRVKQHLRTTNHKRSISGAGLMQKLFTQTDKKLIPTLPRYAFGGRIVVVQSESEVEKAIKYLNTLSIIGIDTETRPSFRRGSQHKVALLQMSSDSICFLFRLSFIGFPDSLARLLENPDILKVGLSLKDDIARLRQRRPDLTPQGFVELQQIADEMGITDMSLAKLFANVFGQRISKNAQLSNWEADILDEKQKLYAATDADACLRLYRTMTELRQTGLFELIPPPEGEIPPVSQSKASEKEQKTSRIRSRKQSTPQTSARQTRQKKTAGNSTRRKTTPQKPNIPNKNKAEH